MNIHAAAAAAAAARAASVGITHAVRDDRRATGDGMRGSAVAVPQR